MSTERIVHRVFETRCLGNKKSSHFIICADSSLVISLSRFMTASSCCSPDAPIFSCFLHIYITWVWPEGWLTDSLTDMMSTVCCRLISQWSNGWQWSTQVHTTNPTINSQIAAWNGLTATTSVAVILMWLTEYLYSVLQTQTVTTAPGGVTLNCCPRFVGAKADIYLVCFICWVEHLTFRIHQEQRIWLSRLTNRHKHTSSFLFVDYSVAPNATYC